MLKKTLFILLSIPSFLPSCPDSAPVNNEEIAYEEIEKAREDNALPLSTSKRPQVIVTPLAEKK